MGETLPNTPPGAGVPGAQDSALHHSFDVICQTALATYRSLGAGRAVGDYVRALSQRLRRQGLSVDTATPPAEPAPLRDGPTPAVRLLIDGSVLLQIHAQRGVEPADEGELIDGLDACAASHGAILNFGEIRFLMKRLDRQG